MKDTYVKSPLNYVGGKHKLLEQIFQVLPNKINTFVDLFAGGCNVGINANASNIICNDELTPVIELYQYFQQHSLECIIDQIQSRIEEFCLKGNGEVGYYQLRERYNKDKDNIDFYTLVCHSFNRHIRFNKKREFNISFGHRTFNNAMKEKLICFHSEIQSKNIMFTNADFREVDLSKLTEKDLVYCDPPYLISKATYNVASGYGNGWGIEEEYKLLNLLDELHKQGTRFALSNVFEHNGAVNNILMEWSKKYKVHNINSNYNNCVYHLKDKQSKTKEVLITNFC